MKKSIITGLFLCAVMALQAQQIPILKMTDVVHSFSTKNDTTYVINFWATFCKPCVAEIPDFIKITNKYKTKKVKLLLVSVDLPLFYPNKIAAFAKKNNFNTNIAWLNETNADYFCPMIDSSWSGAIPATIIVNSKTGYKKFWEAEITAANFEKELKKAIETSAALKQYPKLISPMSNIVLIKYYDKEEHPLDEYPYEQVIFTAKDNTVYAASDGEVISIIDIDSVKAIIVQRGGLFYTYSNLKNVRVKKGELVTTHSIIGYAALGQDEQLPTLDFYVNTKESAVTITKNNFIPRVEKSKSYLLSPMLGIEPE